MLARNTNLCMAVLAGAVSALYSGDACVYAQSSFLERLEATVREQLSNPVTADSSDKNLPSEEELPSPPSATGNARESAPPSILEGRATLPSPMIVPTPQAGTANVPPQSGRIYLGLEAEETTGGGIGVRVTKVTENSPAWKGGIRVGDRISGVNGFAINNLDSMVEQLGKTAPGETVRFLVNRNDRNLQLVAVLMDAGLAANIAGGPLPIGQRPGSSEASNVDGSQPPTADSGAPWLGVSFSDLTAEFRRQFGLSVFRGAAVTSVANQSPAAKVGIMAGDAITSVDGLPIETGRDLMLWLDTARAGQTVQIGYQRGTLPRTATLTLEVTPEARSANRPATASERRARDSANGPPAPPTLDRQAMSQLELTVPAPLELSQPAPTSARDGGVVPNTIPTAKTVAPTDRSPNGSLQLDSANDSTDGSTAEIAKLQREVSRLRSELEKANQRLESTQNRLKQILEGLGQE